MERHCSFLFGVLFFADQDLLNIYFHEHPERVLPIPCDWNYRPDHCIYGSNCPLATNTVGLWSQCPPSPATTPALLTSALNSDIWQGAWLVHGNRGVFQNRLDDEKVHAVNRQPAFYYLFELVRDAPGERITVGDFQAYLSKLSVRGAKRSNKGTCEISILSPLKPPNLCFSSLLLIRSSTILARVKLEKSPGDYIPGSCGRRRIRDSVY